MAATFQLARNRKTFVYLSNVRTSFTVHSLSQGGMEADIFFIMLPPKNTVAQLGIKPATTNSAFEGDEVTSKTRNWRFALSTFLYVSSNNPSLICRNLVLKTVQDTRTSKHFTGMLMSSTHPSLCFTQLTLHNTINRPKAACCIRNRMDRVSKK